MITKEQFNAAKAVIKEYELEQLQLLRQEHGKTTVTSIPIEKWGVHVTHCCFKHGCKYGHVDCPVELGLIKQRHSCEYCHDEED